MPLRSKTRGQQHRKWAGLPIRVALAFAAIIPAIIQITPEGMPSETVQLPEALRTWDRTETASSMEALNSLKAGVALYNRKQYGSALGSLPGDREAEAADIGDFVLLYRAESKFMMEQYREALDDFLRLENRHVNSSLIDEALLGQCQAFLQLKDPESALAVLARSKMEANTEVLYCRARALYEAGEKVEAVALYPEIYSEHPTSEHSSLSEDLLLSFFPEVLSNKSSYGVRLRRAESLLEANDIGAARALLVELGKTSAPNSESSQKRILLLAEIAYRRRQTSAALSHLRKVTNANPLLHSRALYLEGACYRRLQREEAFLALRDKALKLFPDSPDTEELCYSAATYFDVNYQPAKAREAYRILHHSFPKGRRSERALWKLAFFSFMNKQYSDALLAYWRYLPASNDPLSAASAMYWMGRCYAKLGDYDKAQYLYGRTQKVANASYYGQRAREAETALQKSKTERNHSVSDPDFERVTAICDGIHFAPVHLPEQHKTAVQVIERVRRLVHGDLHDLALSELRWAIRQYPDNEDSLRYIMSCVYESRGDYFESIVSLRRAFPDYYGRPIESLPDQVWRLFFPVLHWEIISEQAVKTRLDPLLILGVIRQESAFEEGARSSSGARGLMQILPSTGRMLARQAQLSAYNSSKLFQAETNITLGIRYLATFLQKYKKTELALSAYNAGETRVKRWVKEFGDTDMAEFVEQIPFSETRNYVKRVLGYKAYYDLLIPNPKDTSRRETE